MLYGTIYINNLVRTQRLNDKQNWSLIWFFHFQCKVGLIWFQNFLSCLSVAYDTAFLLFMCVGLQKNSAACFWDFFWQETKCSGRGIWLYFFLTVVSVSGILFNVSDIQFDINSKCLIMGRPIMFQMAMNDWQRMKYRVSDGPTAWCTGSNPLCQSPKSLWGPVATASPPYLRWHLLKRDIMTVELMIWPHSEESPRLLLWALCCPVFDILQLSLTLTKPVC